MRKPPCTSMWSFYLVHLVLSLAAHDTKPHAYDAVIPQSCRRGGCSWNHTSQSMKWFPYFKIENRPVHGTEPPAFCLPYSMMQLYHSVIETLPVLELFLNSLIQNLSVHNVVSPFHDKHTLNLSNCSKFHDTEPPSSWCWSSIPDLPGHNAIPPFNGTEPPSSWYYSPNPWRCPAILW